jgi:CheY-like chemotaxis protein/Tfp pilus assembly protein PilZ
MDLGAVFERAVGDRLVAAERLTAWLPELLGGRLLECDAGYEIGSRAFLVSARTAGTSRDEEARFRYWCARAGGMPGNLGAMGGEERKAFVERLAGCSLRTGAVPSHQLSEAVARLADQAGAPPDRGPAGAARPTLSMDAGSAAFAGVTWDPIDKRLFIPGAIAPPVGDELGLSLRVPSADRPLEAGARVATVRVQEASSPGRPAGFELALGAGAGPLVEALNRHAARPEAPGANSRAAPRYAVNAPVKVHADPGPTARLEYASPQEFADDFVENLSQGGAFVRTQNPLPVGTRLNLEMRLPGSVDLRAPALVMFANPRGMGVKIELDEAGREKLAAVLARISARPRRALLVDDDALILRALGDRLASRGFEVLTARDGQEGLHIVANELLTLDLLITDVRMPEMDGETFVRTIRDAGGESELAIVVIAGTLDRDLEERLERAGADAVLDKALGPEDLAAAADAALEQKRGGAAG